MFFARYFTMMCGKAKIPTADTIQHFKLFGLWTKPILWSGRSNTLHCLITTMTTFKPQGCVDVCVPHSVCVCVFDRTTQVFSPCSPRYHQSLSSSFIKHCRCTWGLSPPPPPLPCLVYLAFFLPLFSLAPTPPHPLCEAFPYLTPGRPEDMQIVLIPEELTDVVGQDRKGKGINKVEGKTADNISIPPLVLRPLP